MSWQERAKLASVPQSGRHELGQQVDEFESNLSTLNDQIREMKERASRVYGSAAADHLGAIKELRDQQKSLVESMRASNPNQSLAVLAGEMRNAMAMQSQVIQSMAQEIATLKESRGAVDYDVDFEQDEDGGLVPGSLRFRAIKR